MSAVDLSIHRDVMRAVLTECQARADRTPSDMLFGILVGVLSRDDERKAIQDAAAKCYDDKMMRSLQECIARLRQAMPTETDSALAARPAAGGDGGAGASSLHPCCSSWVYDPVTHGPTPYTPSGHHVWCQEPSDAR